MFGWFRSKSFEEQLDQSKKIKINGLIFHIRKLDMFDYMSGAKTMVASYQTYEQARVGEKAQIQEGDLKKIKEHYKDVFCAAVVEPKLARTEKDPGLLVDKLFTDKELVDELYFEILAHTFGKKKLMSHLKSQGLS